MDRQRKISLEWRVFLSIALISLLTYLLATIVIHTLSGGLFSQFDNNIMEVVLLGVISVGVVSIAGYILSIRIIMPRRFGPLDNLERKYEELIENSAEMIHQVDRNLNFVHVNKTELKKLGYTLEEMMELKDSEEKYKSLWDNAEDTMIRVDLDKRMIAVNRREEEILGYPRGDLFGKEIYFILPIEYHNIFDGVFKEALKGEKPPTTEVQVINNAKALLAAELDIRGIWDGNEISSVQIHFRDITGRKKLEQQLMRAEKMAVLSRFTTTLAHDLRNPVIGIKKTLEMLQQFPASLNGDTSQKVFADLITSSDLLLGMINDVLDLYQDSYKELPLLLFNFFMAETLEEVIKLLRFQIEEKRVYIEIDGPMDLFIHGDKRRLQRVFINLLDNAIKFSPSGGRIKIAYRPVICENLKHLYFEIIDEGPGIRPEDLPKIFEPFFVGEAMKSFKKGAGLGLCFCKAIVEAHHGKIWAENRENYGAAFCISLPIEEEGVANV